MYEDKELEFIMTGEGRAVKQTDGSFRYDYFLTDHLGNVRVTFTKDANDEATVVQENHYYPFGMTLGGLDYYSTVYNDFMYQGKEFQKDVFDLNNDQTFETQFLWHDFHARFYDSQLGRWHVPDPILNEASPYIGMGNNPISLVDPNGMVPGDPPCDGCPMNFPPGTFDQTDNIVIHTTNSIGVNGYSIYSSPSIYGAYYNGGSPSYGGMNNTLTGGSPGNANDNLENPTGTAGRTGWPYGSGGGCGGGGGNSNLGGGPNFWMIINGIDPAEYKRQATQAQLNRAITKINTKIANTANSLSAFNNEQVNNAVGTAGLGWGVIEQSIFNKHYWLGKNGKYYSRSWGGNQWTGARSFAQKSAAPAKVLGKIAFGVNLGFGMYGIYHGVSSGNYSEATFSGLGVFYSGIATFGGPPGLIIAGPMILIDATIGLDNVMNHVQTMEEERSNRISNGDWSLWAYPRFGQSVR